MVFVVLFLCRMRQIEVQTKVFGAHKEMLLNEKQEGEERIWRNISHVDLPLTTLYQSEPHFLWPERLS